MITPKPLLVSLVFVGLLLPACIFNFDVTGAAIEPHVQHDPEPLSAVRPESGGLIAGEVARANATIQAIVELPDDQRTIANTLTAVDDVQWDFIQSVRMEGFLAAVSTDAAVRERGRRIQVETSAWFDKLYQNVDLYHTVQAFCEGQQDLQGEDARYRDVLLRDFKRKGVDLNAAQRAELLEIENQLQELGIEFRTNIDEDETSVLLTTEECRGVSESALARVPRKGPLYSVPLVGSAVSDFFAYCEVEETRFMLSIAYSKRGGTRIVAVLEDLLRDNG